MDLAQFEQQTLAEVDQLLQERIAKKKILISEVVDLILQKAVLCKTSDIHIEPTKRGIRVRFRIDGMFQELTYLPVELHDQVVSRIKVMGDLISHKREVTQEGRISVKVATRQQDMRVSIIPTVAGEKVVLRMFTSAKETFDLDKLGYGRELVRRIKAMLYDLQGMMILCGPSGAGKTTTLYSLVGEVSKELDNYASIVSIEDPVEYEFGTFGQMQVNRQAGLDFAKGLSAILRQDPEVIMVGEVRDIETCEVALRAGLTGHLVLTTIHSGSACEVITRILNMGIEPFIVASALTGVIAQRLVREICADCRQPFTPERSKVEFLERALGRKDLQLFRGKGCPTCQFSGYRGRLPIAELLEFDDGLRSLILEKAQTSMLRKYAQGRGMKMLMDDGLEKVAEGKTTLEEVLRVVSLREGGMA